MERLVAICFISHEIKESAVAELIQKLNSIKIPYRL